MTDTHRVLWFSDDVCDVGHEGRRQTHPAPEVHVALVVGGMAGAGKIVQTGSQGLRVQLPHCFGVAAAPPVVGKSDGSEDHFGTL